MLMELPALTACTFSAAMLENSAVEALATPLLTVAAPAFMAAVMSSPAMMHRFNLINEHCCQH
jgi:hypothetical protein